MYGSDNIKGLGVLLGLGVVCIGLVLAFVVALLFSLSYGTSQWVLHGYLPSIFGGGFWVTFGLLVLGEIVYLAACLWGE